MLLLLPLLVFFPPLLVLVIGVSCLMLRFHSFMKLPLPMRKRNKTF